MNLLCKLVGHKYLVLQWQNYGRYYHGDGSKAQFAGMKASVIQCHRCKEKLERFEES